MIRAIIKFFLILTTKILYRVKVIGQENIENDKPYVMCPNHTSNWDPPVLAAILKRNDVYFLAKEEMFINGFIKWLAVKVHALPVKRGKQDIGLIRNTTKVLKENHIVLLFPEGTRNGIKKNGKIQNGAVLISLMGDAPIVPVGIRAEKKYKLFSKVIVNIGKPVDISEYKSQKSDKEILESLSKKLMNDIIQLTNEEN